MSKIVPRLLFFPVDHSFPLDYRISCNTPHSFKPEECSGTPIPYNSALAIFYFSVFLVASVFWFVFIRHLLYGLLVNAATHAEPFGEGKPLRRIMAGITQHVLNHKILIIPSYWFFSAGKKTDRRNRFKGIMLCGFLSFLATVVVFLLMG